MRWMFLIAVLSLSACANSPQDECGDKFVLLWPNASQSYSFQEIQLPTLKSPYELKGSAAEIFYQNGVNDEGYAGSVARPHLTRSGGVCVPMDAGSSLALTTYGHFERLQKFDQELKADGQISWPRRVGVDIHLRSPDGGTHNNAHYLSRADVISVIPYNLDGVSLGLNPGVLGHEHFHAHFQSQVIRPLNDALEVVLSAEKFFYQGFKLKPTVEDIEGSDLNSVGALNKFVLRSWNEGLADLYGAIFSEQSDFFMASLPKLAQGRDLGGDLTLFKSGEDFAAQSPHGGAFPLAQVSTSYAQGSLLARVLYRIAVTGEESPREFLARLLHRLDKIPSAVSASFSRRVMSFDEILPVLLEGYTLNPSACAALRQSVTKPLLLGSFSQCVQ